MQPARIRLPLFLSLIPMLLLAPALLFAGEFEAGESITVRDDRTEDLYVAAGTVDLEADVTGDAVLAGGRIRVAGATTGDLQVAGGQINLTGRVGDDLRAAAGQLHWNGRTGGDAVIMGGELDLGGDGIGQDLVAAGGEITLAAPVAGNARLAGSEVRITGDIGGDLIVRAEHVRIEGRITGKTSIAAETIELGPDASFAGPVRYWSANQPDFGPADARRDESLHPDRFDSHETSGEPGDERSSGSGWLAFGVLGFFWSVFSGALSIAALVLLFPGFVRESAAIVLSRTAEPLGRGAIFVLASPMAILLLVLTVLGIPLAGLWLAVYVFALLFSQVILAAVFAAYLLGRGGREYTATTLFFAAVGVLAVLRLLSLVPLAGFLLAVLWAMLATGLVIGKLLELRGAASTAG